MQIKQETVKREGKKRLVKQNMQIGGGDDDVSDRVAPPGKQKVAYLSNHPPPPRDRRFLKRRFNDLQVDWTKY